MREAAGVKKSQGSTLKTACLADGRACTEISKGDMKRTILWGAAGVKRGLAGATAQQTLTQLRDSED